MAEVRLEHIYKTYKGGVEAVIDLNLTIRNGEFLALLGPSGCGKTSTLRMIVGLESITKGDLFIGNRRMNDLEPNQRNAALAFESYALYPPLTVFDNIAFCLRARRIEAKEVERRVLEVANMLEISDILKRKPAELGGGQKQRISLARALVRDPDVFLMDEPLSHLDAALRAHMRVELKRLHARTGRTTVLVTHDQLEAVAMAERVAVMNFGVLQQVGTFEEIYNHPVNEFVAGFIGEPPMNFLLGQPTSEDGRTMLRASDGSFKVRLPDELGRKLESSKNLKQVKLGVRPIDVIAAKSASGNGVAELEGSVFTFEELGEEGQLAAKVGPNDMLVVTPPAQQYSPAQKVWLQLRTNRIHLFNADTGVAL
ncbi:MAG: ABC transporter ATP-binding protein [Chloroflexi bacterium]|nr:ABC transporter ATP-binding protein [Chloroflexota bacterium]